jgi:prolyl-tRNA editing enzyme YbaK/EbsC (Cys-tRNA(Pro) deacylase)
MTTPLLNPDDLQAYLRARGIPGEILHLEAPTPTVETAAQAVGTDPDCIVKSILFLVDGRPVLAIACGRDRVETRALAARFGVGRKRVKLAAADVVLRETGFEVGTMPPFGHRQPLLTLLDRRVLARDEVYAGGGAENALLRISPRIILQAAQAEVLDLLDAPDQRPVPGTGSGH